MNESEELLDNKISKASKLFSVTEIIAKIFVPITNMILARIISPDEFGIIASITMIVSFVDLFTEAGFQKYIIQKSISNELEERYYNIAFTSNIVLSALCYLMIVTFRIPIAKLLGSTELALPLCVASLSLIITAFTSVQTGVYRRNLNYGIISLTRILSVLIPFVITIPLAFLGYGIWSLIIGSLFGNITVLVTMFIKSKWKPKLMFNVYLLKEMLNFSAWSMGEAITIWAGTYVGVFLLTIFKNEFYSGLYKVSLTTTEGILATIYAPIISVMYASLPKYKMNLDKLFEKYVQFVSKMGLILIPLGVGIYLYKDIVTYILLGKNWVDAENFIGIWGIVVSLTVLIGQSGFEFYRSIGNAKLPFIIQGTFIILLIISLRIAVNHSYNTFIVVNSVVKLSIIILNLLFLKFMYKLPITKLLNSIIPYILSTLVMSFISIQIRKISDSFTWSIVSILICVISYFTVLFIIKKIVSTRMDR